MTATSAPAVVASRSRVTWIDNLRILLTILVILLHLSIGYGAPGDWYYNEEGSVSTLSAILLTLFVAINQAFFMGFFFMVSSYFGPASLRRKGAGPYLRDRFRRLGIPILVYALLVNPMLVAYLNVQDRGGAWWPVFRAGYRDFIAVGPTWFLEALLLFSVGLVVFWRIRRPRQPAVEATAPPDRHIALTVVGLALLSFLVRIWLPVGWWLEPVHFQLAHFPQYLVMFALGVVAHQRGWFDAITQDQGWLWFRVVVGLIVIFPVLFAAGGGLGGSVDVFLGGLTWQQLAFATWEQAMCLAMVVALVVFFRSRVTRQGRIGAAMSRGAYSTYVFHAPVITVLAVILSPVQIDLGVKFLLVAPIAVAASFAVGFVMKRLPVARDIL